MKPMKAHKYKPGKMAFPCYVQPKLNGIRAIWVPGKGLNTYEQKVWDPCVLPHIHEALEKIETPLDGELYCHGLSLQQINARVAVNRVSPHTDVARVSFNVFDAPSPRPFQERSAFIEALSTSFDFCITVVQTVFVSTPVQADMAYRLFKAQKYEGMIYRQLDAPYGYLRGQHPDESLWCGNKENRWNYILKRKDWLDMICTIKELKEGKGQFEGSLGSFIMETPDGKEVDAGSGLTIQQRTAFWECPQLVLGARVRINYEMLSDTGVPLKPTIEEVDIVE